MRIAIMKELPGAGPLIDLAQWAGHNCLPVASAAGLRSMLRSQTVDLVVFPWNKEGGESLDMLRVYRDFTSYRLPAIATVADEDPASLQRAFSCGVDDCLILPCPEAEIVVRLNVALRRNYPRQFLLEPYREGPFTIDPLRREVSLLGAPLDLTPSEFGSAHCFFSNLGRPLSREYVNAYCGRRYTAGSVRIIDQHVCNLRRKLKLESIAPYSIKSLYSFGYQMCSAAPRMMSRPATELHYPTSTVQLLAA
jgi:DNA-binding response OmpR family regulator